MIEIAAQLSKQWHEGQVDKAGKPYWTHPARVAKNVQTWPGFTDIEAYCARIHEHPLARAVKLADLSDNCNPQRQAELRAQGVQIDENKYPKVLSLLKPNLQEIAWFQVLIRFDGSK